MTKLPWILGSIVVVVIVFLISDCAAGKTRFLECYVIGHEYKAAWTEIYTSTDSDGHTHIHTIQHPEEYHVICFEHGESTIDVQTSRGIYYVVTNTQEVTVKIREGRFTTMKWMPQIDL